MLTLLRRYRELIVVGALLAYPLIQFLAQGRRDRELHLMDRAILAIASPLQRALVWTGDGILSGVRGYMLLRSVKQDNGHLSNENAQLRSQLNALTEARGENERLRKLLGYAEANPGAMVAAKLVGVNPVSTMLSVRLDQGETAGVRKGMAVVTADGIVGRVLRANGSACDVLLLTDSNHRVAVRNQRTRARAQARGGGDGKFLRLDYALRTDELKEGDEIVTAGTDGVFPPGLVVGKLTSLEHRSSGPLQSAQIVPAVDPTQLEEVMIITSPLPNPDAPLEPSAALQPKEGNR